MSSEEPCAYAKLWGKRGEDEFAAYVTALPVQLGRTPGKDAAPSPHFIDLGDHKALSRHHATIDWNPTQKHYTITCKGKNGMVVGGKYRGKDGSEVLQSRTAIKLGVTHLYFLLPEESKPPNHDPAAPEKPEAGGGGAAAEDTPTDDEVGEDDTPVLGAGEPAATAAAALAEAAAAAPTAAAVPIYTKGALAAIVEQAFRDAGLEARASEKGGLAVGDILGYVLRKEPSWWRKDEQAQLKKDVVSALESPLFRRASGADAGAADARWLMQLAGDGAAAAPTASAAVPEAAAPVPMARSDKVEEPQAKRAKVSATEEEKDAAAAESGERAGAGVG
ncbi:unnamed protein product [Phaeothamnion confervicola]